MRGVSRFQKDKALLRSSKQRLDEAIQTRFPTSPILG